MPKPAPSFFQLAVRPKWIGALLLSLLVAAIFAAFGQWQLERSFTKNQSQEVVYGVEQNLMLDTQTGYLVANRNQAGVSGYWVSARAYDETGKSFALALGWVADLSVGKEVLADLRDSIQPQAFLPRTVVELAAEAPQPTDFNEPMLLQTFSPAQLVNLYSPEKPLALESNPWAQVSCGCDDEQLAHPKLTAIKFAIEADSINWLSLFYFVEWVVFAVFAVFLWWRLVRDEQIRLQSESVE